MNVTIVVPTRFHAFHTAAQLHRRGALRSVVTGLPRARIRRHSALPDECFRSVPLALLPRLVTDRAPGHLREAFDLGAFGLAAFDRIAARSLPAGADVCVGYAGCCRHTLNAARARGMLTVVERHSVHCRTQMELLAAEHDSYGVPLHVSTRLLTWEEQEYERADVISVPSEFVARSFVERGVPRERILKVPLGVDLRRFQPQPRSDTRFRVLFAGQFTLQKGVQYLLEAWRKLRMADAELLFVGSVDESVRSRLRPTDLPGVRLLGPVPQPRLVELYSNADLFCLPSVQDGFGMVMAEAMACGLPVIHSTHTGGAEIIESGVQGIEVPARDADALAEAIQQLRDDPDRRAVMARAAVERVQGLGGWDAYGDAYLEGLEGHLRSRG